MHGLQGIDRQLPAIWVNPDYITAAGWSGTSQIAQDGSVRA